MNLLDFAASGGTVSIFGQPLNERLSPRQLKYLFAIGAFTRGRTAMRLAKGSGSSRQDVRAAGKAAMSKQVSVFRERKKAAIAVAKASSLYDLGQRPDIKRGKSASQYVLRGARREVAHQMRSTARGQYHKKFPQAKPLPGPLDKLLTPQQRYNRRSARGPRGRM